MAESDEDRNNRVPDPRPIGWENVFQPKKRRPRPSYGPFAYEADEEAYPVVIPAQPTIPVEAGDEAVDHDDEEEDEEEGEDESDTDEND